MEGNPMSLGVSVDGRVAIASSVKSLEEAANATSKGLTAKNQPMEFEMDLP